MKIIVAGFCIAKDKSLVISLVWSHTNKSRPILRPKFVNKVEIDHKIELSRAVIIYRLVCDQGFISHTAELYDTSLALQGMRFVYLLYQGP